MRLMVSNADAMRTRRHTSHNGTPFWHTTFIGTNVIRQQIRPADSPQDPTALYPMAFIVEQDPLSVSQAHFHQADQFQVFIAGNGKLGAQCVSSVVIQFTNAYTPYGPIQAGDSGLSYFTFRRHWDPGARFMPQARGELRGRNSMYRQIIVEVGPVCDTENPDHAAHGQVSAVIAPEPAGLGAWLYSGPPGGSVTGPEPALGGGQYWLVLGGEIVANRDVVLPTRSCAFLSSDEPAFSGRAAQSGVHLLLMQFPR